MTRSQPSQHDSHDEPTNIKAKFLCPKCGEALDEVRVYSEAYQIGLSVGNKIVDYGRIEDLTEAIAIECAHCNCDLIDHIEQ